MVGYIWCIFQSGLIYNTTLNEGEIYDWDVYETVVILGIIFISEMLVWPTQGAPSLLTCVIRNALQANEKEHRLQSHGMELSWRGPRELLAQ